MGIKNLRKFLDKYAPSSFSIKKFEDYENKTIAIDTSLVLYKYIAAMRKTGKDLTTKDGTVTSHLHGLIFLINKLMSHKITPVFVFDGKAPDIKKDTLSKRHDHRKNAEDKLLDLESLTPEEKISYFMQTTKLSHDIIKDTKQIQEYNMLIFSKEIINYLIIIYEKTFTLFVNTLDTTIGQDLIDKYGVIFKFLNTIRI